MERCRYCGKEIRPGGSVDAWGQVRWLSADTLQGSPTGMWSTRRCLQVPGDGYHEPAAALVPDLNDPSAVRAWLD